MLPYIVIGVVLGSVYSLAGVGLVLTYKTTGIFNFAQGSVGTVAAFLFYTLHVQHGVPWPLAALICVVVAGPLVGLIMERISRRLPTAPLALQVVSTVGIVLIVEAVVTLIYGTAETRNVPEYLSQHGFHISGTVVTESQLVTMIFGLVVTAILLVLLKQTRLGTAMRAVVNDPDLLDIAGTSPVRIRRVAWAIGSALAAAAGVLLAPLVASLDGTTLTLLVVQAFGAAALGSFTSLGRTYAGGILMGVGSSLATEYSGTGLLSGLPSGLPFIVLFLVLLLSPKRTLARTGVVVPPVRSPWIAPTQFQLLTAAVALVALGFVPHFAGFHLGDFTLMLVYVILFLSLGLLVRTSGQVSLCHITFMAIGVCAFYHLSHGPHLPWGVAVFLAGLVAVPIGAVLAIPAIRLSGLYLALATFGFAVLVSYMFYTQSYMFGNGGGNISLPRPRLTFLNLTGDRGFYYLVLVLTLAAALIVVAIDRSRLGRLLGALNDSPTALASTGVSVDITRVLVFCVSAFLAAVAGAIGGAAQQTVTGASYGPLLSLSFFVLIIISPGRLPWYALAGGIGLAVIPSYWTSPSVANYLTLLFGVSAVVYCVLPSVAVGPPRVIQHLTESIRVPYLKIRHPGAAPSAVETGLVRNAPDGRLEVQDIRVRFGGVRAVDGVSLSVATGQIVGLIGPNGAGKTTLFNACCGLVKSSGSVLFDTEDLKRKGIDGRARGGIGRTFQRMALFESRTVAENVAMGAEGAYAGSNPFRHLFSRRYESSAIAQATFDAMTLCGVDGIAKRPVSSLSTGQRRLVELARCLAGPFRILLLDEPSSGLDQSETERFGEVLRTVVADRRVGVLLVEHDMALVSSVCSYVYVIDFGRPLFEGPPRITLESEAVRAAYLGDLSTETELMDEEPSAQVLP